MTSAFNSICMYMYPWSTNDSNPTGRLMGVNDTGNVRNRRVAKSQTVVILPSLLTKEKKFL